MINKNQYQCKISSKWMASLENAEISITTPKGGTATVNKWDFGECTSEQAKLVWKIYSHSKESNSIMLTREEIELFAAAAIISKGKIVQATKPKVYYKSLD